MGSVQIKNDLLEQLFGFFFAGTGYNADGVHDAVNGAKPVQGTLFIRFHRVHPLFQV
jgi:hypothetical protein